MEKYSVLMSVYKKENPVFLKESIESILAQTVAADEIVVVCDGPLTEELDAVLKDCQNKYPELFLILPQAENRGLGIALNIGLQHCKNEIIARMDTDDIAVPERMEKQLAIFQSRDVDIVSGTVTEFAESVKAPGAKRVLPETEDAIRSFAKRRNPFNHPAVMYRKSAVLKAGGYQDFYLFEDYYLWVRMLQTGSRGYNLQDNILFMRAGDAMYERRGGFRYAGQIVKFRYYMLKTEFSGLGDFIMTALGHGAVALIPNGLRKLIYEKVLRK